MNNQNRLKLIKIIKQQDWLMRVLREVRNLQLPDWYIAAGAIRNTVWNYLHNFPTTFYQNDIDVAYFNKFSMDEEEDKIQEGFLNSKCPNYKWEVVNQASGHLLEHGHGFIRQPVKSSCESIAYWSETPTCVGIRLEANSSLTICAPHGLSDLMNLIVRPVPKPYQDLSLYRQRIKKKNWGKLWPKLKILNN